MTTAQVIPVVAALLIVAACFGMLKALRVHLRAALAFAAVVIAFLFIVRYQPALLPFLAHH